VPFVTEETFKAVVTDPAQFLGAMGLDSACYSGSLPDF
jgi:hypothetical protein